MSENDILPSNLFYGDKMIDKKISKKDFCKLLAANTRLWLDSKDWMNIFKIEREVILKEIIRGNKIQTPLGKFEAIHSPVRKVKIPNQNKYIQIDGSNLRVKFTPADYFKEKLNAERNK